MLCEICHKNQATIHIQEIVKGEKKSLHICGVCAEKKGLNEMALQGINIAEILYKISANMDNPDFGEDSSVPLLGEDGSNEAQVFVQCSKCGWDVKQFQKTGRVGCEECYKAFSEILSETLKSMHKGILHVGKHPQVAPAEGIGAVMAEVMELQKQLEVHVLKEEFELAAEIRDKINELKAKAKAKKTRKK